MASSLTPKVKSTFKLGLWSGCLSYLGVLFCVVISNLSLFDPNWPFGLFASFTSTLLFCLPFVLLVAVKLSRPLAIVIILSAILAFYRFVSFDHYVSPTGSDCSEEDCTTIVMTNLRRSELAVETLAQMLAGDFDVLVLTEVPPALSTRDLETLFGGSVLRPTGSSQHLGSRLAIISRLPEEGFLISRRIIPQGETTPRAFLVL